jgi:cyclic di-GMP phosphodiesterase
VSRPSVVAVPSPAGARVVVVEDDGPVAIALLRLLGRDGFTVDLVHDGEEALEAIRAGLPDVILLDWMLPKMTGLEVCRILKRDRRTRLIPIVILTGLADRAHRLAGINAGADDFLSKPFDPEELRARIRSLARLKRYTDDLESAESVITSLALTVEARDWYTEGHCQRLAQFGMMLGAAIGLREEDIATLERGGYLHDVGKIGIPDSILNKPSALTPAEYEIMKQHTLIGERLCSGLRTLAPVLPIIRHHHERLDGSGYPDGLRGSAVPLLAQIIAIVDLFDAVTTARPYRPARDVASAREELTMDARAGRFDTVLVSAFLDLVDAGHVAQTPAPSLPPFFLRGR